MAGVLGAHDVPLGAEEGQDARREGLVAAIGLAHRILDPALDLGDLKLMAGPVGLTRRAGSEAGPEAQGLMRALRAAAAEIRGPAA